MKEIHNMYSMRWEGHTACTNKTTNSYKASVWNLQEITWETQTSIGRQSQNLREIGCKEMNQTQKLQDGVQ